MTLPVAFTLLCVLASSLHANTADHLLIDRLDWQMKKATPDIQVFSAKVPDSAHRAVLSTTIVNTDSNTVARLIRDTSTRTQWVYRCQSSYRYQQISKNEEYIYTVSTLPFPLNKRDILAHIHWQQHPETRVITATAIATQGLLGEKTDITRIKNAKMIWQLLPTNKGQTLIRSFVHVDPSGAIPGWLSNYLVSRAPFETMLGLRRILGENDSVSDDSEAD